MSRVLPILFNTDMVRAILDGRKTVTRRVIKHPPHPDMPDSHNYCRMPLWMRIGKNECGFRTLHYMDVVEQSPFKPTRYFESLAPFDKGDILYVRETWAEWTGGYLYKAWQEPLVQPGKSAVMRWHPSIHMPKEAARIWLKVMDVRAEQLQEITNEQILKEGIKKEAVEHYMAQFPETTEQWVHAAHFLPFSDLWNSTIRKSEFDLYSWDSNPWVWAIEFERCEKPEEN
ncbi:hypothetical protein [Parablautia muri]|uniref:Morphogenetic protein n=1 Tax=Parablautia muri TaxID=2320879 RepID=A0A9X5GSI3_9FIRM|nr:hypothetical protein [Parablautia muri]NBJ93219.1 hypothetical protein [Parablautia muri]